MRQGERDDRATKTQAVQPSRNVWCYRRPASEQLVRALGATQPVRHGGCLRWYLLRASRQRGQISASILRTPKGYPMTERAIHVHQPVCTIARTTRRCATCRKVRRFIVRFYEYYESRWTCGGCGCTFVNSEGRQRAGKRQREINRQRVRDQWPFVVAIKEAVANILELR